MSNPQVTLTHQQIVENGDTFVFHYGDYKPREGEALKDIVHAMHVASVEIGLPVASRFDGLEFSVSPRIAPWIDNLEEKVDCTIERIEEILEKRRDLDLYMPAELAAQFAAVEKQIQFEKEAKRKGDEGWALLQSLDERNDEQVMRALSLLGDSNHNSNVFVVAYGEIQEYLELLGYPRPNPQTNIWGKEGEVLGPDHSRAMADTAAAYVAGETAAHWLELYGSSQQAEPKREPITFSNRPDALNS